MIEETIPTDASLLRCTLKKSVSVGKKWLLVAACVIDVLALVVILTIILQYGIPFAMSFVERVLAYVGWVPLWARVIIGLLVLIVGYSFLWCINRDLTYADYKSDCACASSITYTIISVFSFVSGMALLIITNNGIFMVFLIPVIFLMFDIFLLSVSDDHNIMNIEFPGAAFNHYFVDKVEVKNE